MSRASRPRRPVVPTLDTTDFTGMGMGMNDPEVIMLDVLPNSNLTAYHKATEAAATAIDLVGRVVGSICVICGFSAGGWADAASRSRH